MLFVPLQLLPTVLSWENQLPQLTDCMTPTSCKRSPRLPVIAWTLTGTYPCLACSRTNHNLTAEPGLAMVTCYSVVLCTRQMPSKQVTSLRNFKKPPWKYLGHCGIMEVKSLMKDPVWQQYLPSYWTFSCCCPNWLSKESALSAFSCFTALLLFPTNTLLWRTLYSPLRAKLFPLSCRLLLGHIPAIFSWSCSLL